MELIEWTRVYRPWYIVKTASGMEAIISCGIDTPSIGISPPYPEPQYLTVGARGITFRARDNGGASVDDPKIIKTSVELEVIDDGHLGEGSEWIGDSFMQFYTADITKWKVELSYGEKIFWTGYLTPESFRTDLTKNNRITLVARDNLGVLEEIPFDMFDKEFVSLKMVLDRACQLIGWGFDSIAYNTNALGFDRDNRQVYFYNALVNVELFRDMSYWEVLEELLIGYQLRYMGGNLWVVVNIGGIGDYSGSPVWNEILPLKSPASFELAPALKEITVRHDHNVIENFFRFPDYEDYVQGGDRYILGYQTPDQVIIKDLYLNTHNSNPNAQDMLYSGRSFERSESISNTDNAIYLKALTTSNNAKLVFDENIPANYSGGLTIELSLLNKVCAVRSEVVQIGTTDPNEQPQAIFIPNGFVELDNAGTIDYRFSVSYRFRDNYGAYRTFYLTSYGWSEAFGAIIPTGTIITFSVSSSGGGGDSKYYINIKDFPRKNPTSPTGINNHPAGGVLTFNVLCPVIRDTGTIHYTPFAKISDIKMYSGTSRNKATRSTTLSPAPSARKPETIDIMFGSLQDHANYRSYLGGLFREDTNVPGTYIPINKWALIGGTTRINDLDYTEIVARNYALNRAGFTDEYATHGGEIVRGRFKGNIVPTVAGMIPRGVITSYFTGKEKKYDFHSLIIHGVDGSYDAVFREVKEFTNVDYNEKSSLNSKGGSFDYNKY